MLHPFHFAILDADEREARGALTVADIGTAGDVFGVRGFGDVVGNDGVLSGRDGRLENSGDDVLLVGR